LRERENGEEGYEVTQFINWSMGMMGLLPGAGGSAVVKAGE